MEDFIRYQKKASDDMAASVDALTNRTKNVKNQVARLSNDFANFSRGKSNLPGQPEVNPKESCKCINHQKKCGYEGPLISEGGAFLPQPTTKNECSMVEHWTINKRCLGGNPRISLISKLPLFFF